jgi:O-antigen ligase
MAAAVFAVSSQVSAVAQDSSSVDLQSVFLVLLLVGVYFLGEDATVVISRARLWLRGYVLLGLAAGILFSSWALVPPEFGGRSWLPTRLIGLTSSTNYMALIAALAMILEIVNVNRSKQWRLYASLALIACIWAQGRTGLAVAAIGVFCIVLYSRGSIVKGAINFLMLVSLSIGVGFQLAVAQDVADAQRVALDDFATGRLEAWGYAWASFLQYPVFGHGPDFFGAVYWAEVSGEPVRYANAHNQMLHSLGETGLFGAAATVALLTVLSRVAFRRCKATRGASVAMLSVIVVQLPFGAPLALGGLTWHLIPFLLCIALTLDQGSSKSEHSLSSSSVADGGQR